MSQPITGGRINQKQRTRTAILQACRELIERGADVSMPSVAETALVSEATAYRYFPDLVSLLGEVTRANWPDPARALEPIADRSDPCERIAYATEVLMRHVLVYERAVRATIAATIGRSEVAAEVRPGYRFALIDAALAPLADADPAVDADALAQLRQDLAVVVSAEALFTLIDLCRLTPEEAITSAARSAATLTRATLGAG